MSGPRVLYLSLAGARSAGLGLFADMVRANKAVETEVHVSMLPDDHGRFTHVEYRSYEGLSTPGIIDAVRAASREGFDALIIGCFYDPALLDAREVSGQMVVTAPCIASCEIAASLANRFGVIIGRRKWADQMERTVRHHGYSTKLSGFYEVEMGVTEFQKDHAVTRRKLLDAGRRAIEEGHSEALILGCTMELGFHEEMQAELGVPVIDPSIAALKRAEYAAELKTRCGWIPSRAWSCEAPPEDEIAQIASFDNPDALARREVVRPTSEGLSVC